MNRGDLAFSNLRDSSSPLIPLIFIPSALANYSLKHTLIRHGNRWHFQISPEISLKTIAFAYFHADNTFSFRGVPHLQHLCKEGSRHQDHSHQTHTKHFITVMRKYFVTKNCAMGSGPSEQIVMKCKSKTWLSIWACSYIEQEDYWNILCCRIFHSKDSPIPKHPCLPMCQCWVVKLSDTSPFVVCISIKVCWATRQ